MLEKSISTFGLAMLGLLLCTTTPALAQQSPVIPEALMYCTTCHGTNLHGNEATQAPAIAGLPLWYVSKQLNAFHQQHRGQHSEDISGHEMRAAAEHLSQEDIQNAALFISKLQPVPAEISHAWLKALEQDLQNDTRKSAALTEQKTGSAKAQTPALHEGDAKHGKSLYTMCAACHGLKAEGNPALQAPPLRHLNDWYIAKQLINFRHGYRGSDNADDQAKQMQAAAKLLSTHQDIVDVVTYLQHIQ